MQSRLVSVDIAVGICIGSVFDIAIGDTFEIVIDIEYRWYFLKSITGQVVNSLRPLQTWRWSDDDDDDDDDDDSLVASLDGCILLALVHFSFNCNRR